MNKRIWLALIASSILVPGLSGRAVAQIDGPESRTLGPEEAKRAILAARYPHDPRLIPFLSRKAASDADRGLQPYRQQADSGVDAAAKTADFTTFDPPGSIYTDASGINPAGAITASYQ